MNQVAVSRFPLDPSDAPGGAAGLRRHGPAIAAGLLWLAAGLSAGHGVLQALGRGPVLPVTAAPVALPSSDPAAVARALGARLSPVADAGAQAAPPVAEATRYSLLGVIAVPGQGGAALIAVNGEPARPYRVGAAVDAGLVLQSVNRQAVRLGATVAGPTTVELALPVPPPGAS